MYPVKGMCSVCGKETHIFDGICLSCIRAEEEKSEEGGDKTE